MGIASLGKVVTQNCVSCALSHVLIYNRLGTTKITKLQTKSLFFQGMPKEGKSRTMIKYEDILVIKTASLTSGGHLGKYWGGGGQAYCFGSMTSHISIVLEQKTIVFQNIGGHRPPPPQVSATACNIQYTKMLNK